MTLEIHVLTKLRQTQKCGGVKPIKVVPPLLGNYPDPQNYPIRSQTAIQINFINKHIYTFSVPLKNTTLYHEFDCVSV